MKGDIFVYIDTDVDGTSGVDITVYECRRQMSDIDADCTIDGHGDVGVNVDVEVEVDVDFLSLLIASQCLVLLVLSNIIPVWRTSRF